MVSSNELIPGLIRIRRETAIKVNHSMTWYRITNKRHDILNADDFINLALDALMKWAKNEIRRSGCIILTSLPWNDVYDQDGKTITMPKDDSVQYKIFAGSDDIKRGGLRISRATAKRLQACKSYLRDNYLPLVNMDQLILLSIDSLYNLTCDFQMSYK
jgi:hypothetical protein